MNLLFFLIPHSGFFIRIDGAPQTISKN